MTDAPAADPAGWGMDEAGAASAPSGPRGRSDPVARSAQVAISVPAARTAVPGGVDVRVAATSGRRSSRCWPRSR